MGDVLQPSDPLFYIVIAALVVLLLCSAAFSGLNLGVLSIDRTYLEIVMSVGTEKEKKRAKKIAPIRKRGNFLLCTLLLGPVMELA